MDVDFSTSEVSAHGPATSGQPGPSFQVSSSISHELPTSLIQSHETTLTADYPPGPPSAYPTSGATPPMSEKGKAREDNRERFIQESSSSINQSSSAVEHDGSRRLRCLVDGDSVVFTVTVPLSSDISELKKIVQKERELGVLKDVDPHTLELLKVDVNLNAQTRDSLRRLKLEPRGEGVEELAEWDLVSEYWSLQPADKKLHIFVKPQAAHKKRVYIADITADVLLRWSKKPKLSLPSISELPGSLNEPLLEADKIPLSRIQFDNLLSRLTETKDVCSTDDVEKLFRVSDVEASEALHLLFYSAVVQTAPPEDGTEASFHSFWDDNIRKILELLIPSGKSIRDSSYATSTRKLRPDYGFLLHNICPFRGEEKSPTNHDDPKAELSDNLTWIYSPAPYVFGYYAVGPDLTLAAICAPQTPSQMPFVHDLAFANLRFKRDRIANLRRLINLSPYIHLLRNLIGYRDAPEFTVIEREGKSVEIGRKAVKKTYHDDHGEERVRYIQNIYRQLQEKNVPYVDTLTHVTGSTIYVEPKGIAVKPSNEKELLEAIVCVLKALQVLHQPPSLFHRDIRWPNVLRQADNHTLWFLIDWDDAVGSNNLAANHFREEEHSPRVFVDNHGGEVDIWGVGWLIVESTRFAFNISHKLVDLGRWMQDVAPSPQDALIAVETYKLQRELDG